MTEEERREAARRRQARYRDRRKAHDAGDHSDCLPATCDLARVATVDLDAMGASEPGARPRDDAAGDVTGDVTFTPKNSASRPVPPADLGPRGGRLWEEMSGLKLGPAHVLLLERACRLADRLERLDAQLDGGEWLRPLVGDLSELGAVEVRVTIDRALGETRQHEMALKLLVAELRHASRPVAPSIGARGPVSAQGADDDDDDEPGARRAGNVTNIAGILSRPAQG